MYSANEARAKAPNKVEAYLSARIKESAEAGFRSTKAWIDTSQLANAAELLEKHGYVWEETQVDGARSQINISWKQGE